MLFLADPTFDYSVIQDKLNSILNFCQIDQDLAINFHFTSFAIAFASILVTLERLQWLQFRNDFTTFMSYSETEGAADNRIAPSVFSLPEWPKYVNATTWQLLIAQGIECVEVIKSKLDGSFDQKQTQPIYSKNSSLLFFYLQSIHPPIQPKPKPHLQPIKNADQLMTQLISTKATNQKQKPCGPKKFKLSLLPIRQSIDSSQVQSIDFSPNKHQ